MYETCEVSQKERAVVAFLYNRLPGRFLLFLLVRPAVSKSVGFFLNRSVSRVLVGRFAKKNNINLEECVSAEYKSFNDFFTREVRKEFRPLPDSASDLFSPCDGRLTAFPISDESTFHIKNSVYDISGLLQDKGLSRQFHGGVCLVFRLTPNDYHKYCFVDNGAIESHRRIKGVLHTVRPIAHGRYNVFSQNARECTVMRTEHFGMVAHIEIGALLVGRILNHRTDGLFGRGDEKGMFEFGGSTIVMLLQKDMAAIDEAIFSNTRQNRETIVRMGQKIGQGMRLL